MVNVKAVSTGAVTLAGLLGDVLAHPGETHDTEKRRRDLEQNNVAIQHAKRTVAQCSGSETGQKLAKKGAARRAAKAQELREKRGLEYCENKFLAFYPIWLCHSANQACSRYEDQARPGST